MVVNFRYQRPELRPKLSMFDSKICKRMLSTGMQFFVLSIFTSLSLSIDNYIVAHTCSLADVTPYSVMYKIVHLISVVTVMLSTPLWAANGEAMQRGEFGWVKKATGKIMLISFAFSTAASLGLFVLIKPALFVVTNGVVKADYMLLAAMCLMQIAVSVTSPFFMTLNAARIVKFQIVTYLIYALVSSPLKFWLGRMFGMVAITWVGVVTYVLLLTIPTALKSVNYLNKNMKIQ
jgi:O-antigen/teichoic acid export membrane protein